MLPSLPEVARQAGSVTCWADAVFSRGRAGSAAGISLRGGSPSHETAIVLWGRAMEGDVDAVRPRLPGAGFMAREVPPAG